MSPLNQPVLVELLKDIMFLFVYLSGHVLTG